MLGNVQNMWDVSEEFTSNTPSADKERSIWRDQIWFTFALLPSQWPQKLPLSLTIVVLCTLSAMCMLMGVFIFCCFYKTFLKWQYIFNPTLENESSNQREILDKEYFASLASTHIPTVLSCHSWQSKSAHFPIFLISSLVCREFPEWCQNTSSATALKVPSWDIFC